ncbi:MAG: hypothetical protein A2Z24_01310 [Candidatus Woykebacteria bacterium RBG_16_44_10]|uniref:Right handed beta helix domain-containing protein n=1 Tax=Candidatus Woykebacteria bacterium RBG_16_44_10 TaxID=1802597 RepID=A0A1G1WDL3_9BACT|nr:MAG: hypothetical protein A2Z24_01310 [Candidatus Woykebacteria bacterium RBG_16_44_10]
MGNLKEIIRKRSALILIGLVIIAIGVVGGVIFLNSDKTTKESGTPSGFKDKEVTEKGEEVWSGTVTMTGDTGIGRDVIIKPGTVIKFVVGDDQKDGHGVEADGYNDNDPTRLASYEQSHANLSFMGKVTAIGTKEKPIIFTSAAEKPYYADWEGVTFHADGSVFEYIILEYSRHGLSPQGEHSKSVVRNSTFRHNFWAGISGGNASLQIIGNQISDSGHEGIDIQAGGSKAIIERNVIKNCHTGIVVLGGSPTIRNNTISNVGDGIHVEKNATPVLSGNKVTIAPAGTKMEWRYGDFAYQLFDDPITY